MNTKRLLILTRNFANQLNFFSSSPFGTLPHCNSLLQKHRSKADFSTKNLSHHKYVGTKSNLTKSQAESIETLHVEKLEYVEQFNGQNETKIMQIELNRLNSTKWISLINRIFFNYREFVQIFIPEDAYKFVSAMDELMSKIIEQDKPPNCSLFIGVRGGLNYDYGLRFVQYNGRLEFRMKSITTLADPTHIPKTLFMPIRLLPLLRDKMAKILSAFDGSQQIEPFPSPLPKWITEMENDSSHQQQNAITISDETNKQWEISREETLDFSVNIHNEKHDRQITIQLQRNKRGEEFIQIVQKFDKLNYSKDFGEESNKFIYFPPIPMPSDAYRLLDAMDKLYNDLQKKYPNLQIPDDIPFETQICRKIVRHGLLYDYKLEICISPLSKQLEFKLRTITTEAYKLHKFEKLYGPIPMHVFNWLKEQMAELLKSSSNQQEQLKLNNVNGKEQIPYKEEVNKMQIGLIRHERVFYRLEIESLPRLLKIEFKQGKGRKYLQITQRYEKNIGKKSVHYINFPNIPVPEDAYRLLDAMKAIFNELQDKRAAILTGENKSSMICQKIVNGLHYNYKLEIHSCQNQQFDFRLQTMSNKANELLFESKKLSGPIPINIFHWLMEKMAEILVDYDEKRNEENK